MAFPINTSLASGFARASRKYWASIDEIEKKYCHGPKSGLVVDLDTMQLVPDDDEVIDNSENVVPAVGTDDDEDDLHSLASGFVSVSNQHAHRIFIDRRVGIAPPPPASSMGAIGDLTLSSFTKSMLNDNNRSINDDQSTDPIQDATSAIDFVDDGEYQPPPLTDAADDWQIIVTDNTLNVTPNVSRICSQSSSSTIPLHNLSIRSRKRISPLKLGESAGSIDGNTYDDGGVLEVKKRRFDDCDKLRICQWIEQSAEYAKNGDVEVPRDRFDTHLRQNYAIAQRRNSLIRDGYSPG